VLPKSRATEGDALFIPSLLLVASQNRLFSPVIAEDDDQ
jgi:hypothetical protein